MTLLFPSHARGYARNAAESENPGLWRGLVRAWVPSLGPTGGTLRDSAGRGNHGAMIGMDPGAAWVQSGRHGLAWALGFDGADDRVKIPATPGLFLDPAMTLAFWARSNVSDSPNNAYVVSMFDTAGDNRMWAVYVRSSTDDWKVAVSSNGITANSQTTGLGLDTLWHLFAFVVDNPAKTWAFYLDGVFQKTIVLADSYTDQGSFLTIGGLDNSGNTFDGQIGPVTLWNRALRPSEIRYLYEKPLAAHQRNRQIRAMIPAVGGPYRVAAGQPFYTGAEAGETFNTGAIAGQIDDRCN